MIGRPHLRRRGAMLPLVALLLPVLLILASFALNLAYMELTRTELRIACDAATRAAGFRLMVTGDPAEARAAAREGTTRNRVAGRTTQLADSDIQFGVSRRGATSQRYAFTVGGAPPNAVRVDARHDANSLTGAVSMLMPTFGAVNHFEPAQQAVCTHVDVDVVLVLDRSGSMAYGDLENSEAMAAAGLPPSSAPAGWRFCDPAPSKSRWRDLTGAVAMFLKTLSSTPQQEFVGVVTYGDSASTDKPLTNDHASVNRSLDVYSERFCMGYTNIHDGISEGIRALNDVRHARPWAVRLMIVLTDGRRTAGPDPTPAARAAFNQGIAVYAITFAKEADQALMRSVAAAGGGVHYHTATGGELEDLFRTVAHRLPTLITD
ncbi:MAG TPA: VWA domain-containing protein [Lacipirellulaceae bacterium]|nr:VWA domain-containing protein [Lacipirellulaceae bacterium]